ncbi:MAG: FG-GAP-like repeat-containing protein [Prevotella sp.]|nr:FG-GAP-like repeat-containing protein [Prevotella sp.]
MKKKLVLLWLSMAMLTHVSMLGASGYDPTLQPSTMQYFTPVGGKYFVGDCIPFAHNGTYYLYWLLDEGHHSALGGLGGHQWCVSTTTDLVHWDHHPIALGIDEEWEKSICTGSVVASGDLFYAFYATRLVDNGNVCERLSYATSKDALTFTKQQPNPFFLSADGFSQRHFRDPKVSIDEDGVFHLFVSSERTEGERPRGCLVHMTSTDLKDWNVVGTVIDGLNGVPECPDYFKWNDWYYLVFGLGLDTYYVKSKSAYGPWQWPETQALKEQWVNVAKTASFADNRRIVAGWIASRSDGRDSGGQVFGGSVVLRETYQLPNGDLATKFPEEVIPKGDVPQKATITEANGKKYVADMPRNCKITLDIEPDENCKEYGLRLRSGELGDNGYLLSFLPSEQRVRLAHDASIDAVSGLQKKLSLTIIMKDDIIDVDINHQRCIVNRLPDQNGSFLWLYSKEGNAKFSNIEVSTLEPTPAVFDANTILPAYFLDKYSYPVKAMVFNDQIPWNQWREQHDGMSGIVVGTPPCDEKGRQWYDTDYQLTNINNRKWKDMCAPMGTGTWANVDIPADIYLRRTFTINNAINGRLVVKSCFDDAPCEIYLNGKLLVAYPDGNPDGSLSAQYLLSEEDTKLVHTDGTDNVLAMHVHNDFGGSNADLGLYIATPPFVALSTHEYGTQCGNIVAADLTNDGKMELLVAGEQVYYQERPNWLLKKEEQGWTDIGNPLKCHVRPSYSICDFNGDGTMDVVCFENPLPNAYETIRNKYSHDKGIFLGQGDGTFKQLNVEITNTGVQLPENFETPFKNINLIRSGAVADFNNDGLTDIVGIGNTENNVVLINQGSNGTTITFKPIYFDDGIIEGSNERRGRSFSDGFVVPADFNNDGFCDFIVTSNNWDYRQNIGADWERFTEVYLNDGTGEHFRRTYWGLENPSVYNGGIAVADFNNDGYLDVFLSGDGGYFPGTPKAIELTGRQDEGYWEHTMICVNDGTGHFSPLPESQFDRFRVRGLNSVTNVANAYDWNGDGLIDILHQGWCPDENKQSGYIWLNSTDGVFNRRLNYGGGSESATVITDWDGDGIKDVLTTGFCENQQYTDHNYSNGRTFIVTLCSEKPTAAPVAPANVTVTEVDKGKVNITWTPADGAPKNTTYELFIKTADGTLLGNCRAYTDEQHKGLRKVEEAGNRGTATMATFSLPDGSYTVGVQAVDGRRQGSPFCTSQFTLVNGIPTTICSTTIKNTQTHYFRLNGQQAVTHSGKGNKQILVSKDLKAIY